MKDRIRPGSLTHMDESGRPAMVDTSSKPATAREAMAEGYLLLSPAALAAVEGGANPKGDPLLVAQIAGIQAAKRTAELIPLCHPIAVDQVEVRLELDRAVPAIRAQASVRVTARTGVEMEALTAVTVALLTAYDMLKAVDRGMRLDGIRLVRKSGGRSGVYDAGVSDPGR